MRRGFTLIEMLVVLVLVSVLAGLVGPALMPARPAAPTDALSPAIEQARDAAIRRSETVYLHVEPSGEWRIDGAASLTDGPIATGRLEGDAPALGERAATLVVSPLGSCAFDVRSGAAARAIPLDPFTCETRTDSARLRDRR